MKVVYDQNKPIYLQIVEKIKCKIIYGQLKPGDKMLSITDMASEMDVNPNTMFRVYKQLENEGITELKRGLGSYIIDKKNLAKELTNEMADQIIDPAIAGLKNLNLSNEKILSLVRTKLKQGSVSG